MKIFSSRKKASIWIASSLALLAMTGAYAENDQKPPRKMVWAFDGVFGTVDRQSAQRGFQVYKEVCSACHSLSRVAFRNLQDIGFSEAEVKALAASYQINDGPNETGDMFQRAGKPSDTFPAPFANSQAAASANGGVAPPDLSLIIKARHGGADYVYSLLTGFGTPPAGITVADGLYYNPYFPGGQLRMPPPLSDNRVSYTDGTNASLDQEARDVVTFLQWAAEPEMEARKEMGLKVLVYLVIFTAFLYIAKRNLWKKLH